MSDDSLIKGIAKETSVGILVALLIPVIISVLVFAFSAFGVWTIVVGLFVSFCLSVALLWKKNKQVVGQQAETGKLRAECDGKEASNRQLRDKIIDLNSKIQKLEKENRSIEKDMSQIQSDIDRRQSDIISLQSENRNLRATREKDDIYYSEREAGEFILNGIVPGTKVSSRLLEGLVKGDCIQVGAASEALFRVQIVRVINRNTGDFYVFESSDSIRSWRRNFTVKDDGDYAILLESVLESGLVYMRISTFTIPNSNRASMHIGTF